MQPAHPFRTVLNGETALPMHPPAFPAHMRQWSLGGAAPLTVAGPRRDYTGFPFEALCTDTMSMRAHTFAGRRRYQARSRSANNFYRVLRKVVRTFRFHSHTGALLDNVDPACTSPRDGRSQ